MFPCSVLISIYSFLTSIFISAWLFRIRVGFGLCVCAVLCDDFCFVSRRHPVFSVQSRFLQGLDAGQQLILLRGQQIAIVVGFVDQHRLQKEAQVLGRIFKIISEALDQTIGNVGDPVVQNSGNLSLEKGGH
jgi:hypothetical protein